MSETSTNNHDIDSTPENERNPEESKEKKLAKGITSFWNDLVQKEPSLGVVLEQNGGDINSMVESFKNGGGNIDKMLAAVEEVKNKKQEKVNQETTLKSELEEIDRNYGLNKVKEALNEDEINKDKTARKHFELKSGLFKRAWWKLGDAFGINKGKWEALANQDEQEGVDLEKKHRLRKIMQAKKGPAKAFFWNTFGRTDFMRERDKLWKVDDIVKVEKELDKTIKLLGELLNSSVRIDRQRKREDQPTGDNLPTDGGPNKPMPDSGGAAAEAEIDEEERKDLGKDIELLVSAFGEENKDKIIQLKNSIKKSVGVGHLNKGLTNELITAVINKDGGKAKKIIEDEIDRNDNDEAEISLGTIIDKIDILMGKEDDLLKSGEAKENEYEEQLKNLVGEEHFVKPSKKPEEKTDMSVYDKNPNKIFEELADALGAKEYIKRKEERDIMHEFADALNSKESPKKSSEPKKKTELRKDAPADTKRNNENDKDEDTRGNREPVENERREKRDEILKGTFIKTDKGFIYKPGEEINGKEVVYVINKYDKNLREGRINDGGEYSFTISKHTNDIRNKDGDLIHKKGEDWIADENKDQIIYAVWIRILKESEEERGTNGEVDGNVKESAEGEESKNESEPNKTIEGNSEASKEESTIESVKAALEEKKKNLGLSDKSLKKIKGMLDTRKYDRVMRFINQEVNKHIDKNKGKIDRNIIEEERDKIIDQIKLLESSAISESGENSEAVENTETPSEAASDSAEEEGTGDVVENEPESERDKLIKNLEKLLKETSLTNAAQDGIIKGLRNGRARNIDNIKTTVANKTDNGEARDKINEILDKLKEGSKEPSESNPKKKA